MMREISRWLAVQYCPDLIYNIDISREIDQLTVRAETAEEGNKERDEKIRELEERVKLLEVFGDE